MAVILNNHDFFVRADGIKFFAGDKPSLLHRIRRSAESDQYFLISATLYKVADHLLNLFISLRVHDIETAVECGK